MNLRLANVAALAVLCLLGLACGPRYYCAWDDDHGVYMKYDRRSRDFVEPLSIAEHDRARDLGLILVTRQVRYERASDLYFIVEDGRILCYSTPDQFRRWVDSLAQAERRERLPEGATVLTSKQVQALFMDRSVVQTSLG